MEELGVADVRVAININLLRHTALLTLTLGWLYAEQPSSLSLEVIGYGEALLHDTTEEMELLRKGLIERVESLYDALLYLLVVRVHLGITEQGLQQRLEALNELGSSLVYALSKVRISSIVFGLQHKLGILTIKGGGHCSNLASKLLIGLLVALQQLGIHLIEMLIEESQHAMEVPLERPKVKEFGEHRVIVVAFESIETACSLLRLLQLCIHIVGDSHISAHRSCIQRGCEHKSLERAAATEGYIDLPCSEGGIDIQHGTVKREALTLVNGDSPCQAQRLLAKLALYLFAYLLGLLIDDVARIGPHLGLHLYDSVIFDTSHTDLRSIHR